jgi:hypothetical protein
LQWSTILPRWEPYRKGSPPAKFIFFMPELARRVRAARAAGNGAIWNGCHITVSRGDTEED